MSAQTDIVVVGAGFGGLYAIHHFRSLGFAVTAVEAGSGVGGTWYWNRYPGARCDVPSMEYSYQFDDDLQQEWSWKERYAPQPEILAYAEHVADRFDLARHIQFDTRVTAARYDEAERRWHVETDGDASFVCRYLVMATGCLSARNEPDIPGLESFDGPVFHTGRWPHEGVDFAGKRVAVVGTGSSGIQSIPLIAEQAEQLYVFQRTPNYSVPARNGPMDPAYEAHIKANYDAFREAARERPAAFNSSPNDVSALEVDADEHRRSFDERWEAGGFGFLGAFNDIGTDLRANGLAAEYVRGRIRDTVSDPTTAERLSPSTVFGCKRLCLDTDYYETFNLPHVRLVDVSTAPISHVEMNAVVVQGERYEVDAIVLATGFDAMTGALNRIDIRGRGGTALTAAWEEGPKAYLGLAVAGFPNLFTITGPGSPSVLANMITAIEQHVEWLGGMLAHVQDEGREEIEALPDAQEKWVALVREIAEQTFYVTGCNSWYQGANIPGKPRVFMPYVGFPDYAERCDRIAAEGYPGFRFS